MTVLGLPAIPGIASLNWSLERNVAILANPLGNTIQRVIRSGDRWRCSLRFPIYNNDDAGVLMSWLDQVTDGDAWFYLSPPQSTVRGNWSPAEAVTNGTFNSSTSSWAGTGAALSTNARRLKVLNSGAAIGVATQATIAVEANKPHAVIADLYPGKVSQWRIRGLKDSDSSQEFSQAFTSAGRAVVLYTPTTAASKLELACNTSVAGDYVAYGNVSLCRCLTVSGAGQVGTVLNVAGGPASQNAAIKAGEFVAVKTGTLWQLLRLVEDFDTDSSGAGRIVFRPALRSSPVDGDLVIIRGPFSRFLVPNHASPHDVAGPTLHSISLEAIEDLTP